MKYRNYLTATEQWQFAIFGLAFVGVLRFLENWSTHHPHYTPFSPDTVDWLASVHSALQNNPILNAAGVVILAIVALLVLKYLLTKPRIY
jgi:hypothetical protein